MAKITVYKMILFKVEYLGGKLHMYVGFNLITNDTCFKEYNHTQMPFLNQNQTNVKRVLDDFIGLKGSINATEIKNEWFPTINADVFLSHSHKDEDLAKNISAFLYKEYGLITFIDSCVWGYCDELLKQIDNAYCYDSSTDTYNYPQRNRSTSHVHMMLSMALTEMLDKTECVIFLNTPNSITPAESLQQTSSPWIYNELTTTKLIRRQIPRRKQMVKKALFESKSEDMDFRYDVSLEHLFDLTDINLLTLKYLKDEKKHPLDKLYELTIQKK